MKPLRWFAIPILGALLAAPAALAASSEEPMPNGDFSFRAAAEENLYTTGMSAMNDNRWADAASIFAIVAGQHGDHAVAALYWKAYAENKLGQTARALDTCTELRNSYPKSRWIEECGALEIEIRSKSGEPVQVNAQPDENVKLLALNVLLAKDERRALPEIQKILSGDSPERFKERALFVLAQSRSSKAQKMLSHVAKTQSSPVLRASAVQLLADISGNRSLPLPVVSAFAADRRLTLNVVVTDNAGKPVRGLQVQDFSLLDNQQPQKLLSFHAVEGDARAADSLQVVFVIDLINGGFRSLAVLRPQLEAFFKQNGGHLAYPTSIVTLDDSGMRPMSPPTQEGNALLAILDKTQAGLHFIRRSGGFWSDVERYHMTMGHLSRLIADEATRPGRKLMLWISPGWPVFKVQYPVSNRVQAQLFDSIVHFSTGLREAQVTLYSVDPRGIGNSFYYRIFIEGATSPKDAKAGSLALPVMAEHSGGLALQGSNDLTAEINTAVADASAYYVLAFDAPPAAHPSEYHELKVQTAKLGLIARTTSGYYGQP